MQSLMPLLTKLSCAADVAPGKQLSIDCYGYGSPLSVENLIVLNAIAIACVLLFHLCKAALNDKRTPPHRK